MTLALACYTAGTLGQQRSRRILPWVIASLTAGVALDVLAAALMILGSGCVVSLYGLLGYSALARPGRSASS